MSRFIYRALRDDEDPSKGVFVGTKEGKTTRREWIKKLAYHINNGSNISDKTKRYFVSLTEKLECAQKYARGKDENNIRNGRIILIDTRNMRHELTYIKGNEALKREMREYGVAPGTIEKLEKYSADCEVVIDNDISKEKYKELSPLMLEMLDALNITIEKSDPESEPERKLLEFIQSAYFDKEDFEKVLSDTEELNLYEQYFFERYYQQGNSLESILQEMNNAVEMSTKNENKSQMGLEVVEALRVSTIKKLLNSDKTLQYLQEYNKKEYQDGDIADMLSQALQEKENQKEQTQNDNKDIQQRKLFEMRKRLKQNRKRYEELSNECRILESTLNVQQEKYVNSDKRGFEEELRENVYSEDASRLQILKNEIKQLNANIIKIEASIREIEKNKKGYTHRGKLLASKYKGLLIREQKDRKKTKTFREKIIHMTDTMYEEMKTSSAVIACGECGFSHVSKEEELNYTIGADSLVGSLNIGTALVTYETGWQLKQQGGKGNNEKIGARKVIISKEQPFGLSEISEILKKQNKEFSNKLLEKAKNDQARFNGIVRKVWEEDRNKKLAITH